MTKTIPEHIIVNLLKTSDEDISKNCQKKSKQCVHRNKEKNNTRLQVGHVKPEVSRAVSLKSWRKILPNKIISIELHA